MCRALRGTRTAAAKVPKPNTRIQFLSAEVRYALILFLVSTNSTAHYLAMLPLTKFP